MKNIIVPVDFSEKSIQALEVAIDIAKKHHSKITLLHCLELPTRYVTRGGDISQPPEALFFIKIAEQKMTDTASQVTKCGVDVNPVIESLPIIESIEKITEKEASDLIIMGSTGASGVKEVLMGSNAQKVVRYSNTSVLIIKDKVNISDVNDIVFACNMSFKYENAVRKALEFSNYINATLHLLYVNTPYAFRTTKEIEDRINNFKQKFPEYPSLRISVYDDFSIENGISNFAEDRDMDMICMQPTKKHPFYSLFSSSASEDIVNHSEKPILTIKL